MYSKINPIQHYFELQAIIDNRYTLNSRDRFAILLIQYLVLKNKSID